MLQLCIALLGATLFYPDTAPVRCPFASCQRPFAVVVTCVIAAFFITVISFYVIMLYRMHQHNLHCEREVSPFTYTLRHIHFNI